ncbi:pilus assembly protein TadG-related protein [Pseudarthrobacter sp. LT1]|uniref:pilus assembly protein TadG-related protein n=1 Tax=Pseudarthrobacter sp. LT1 TaxID=3111450 RepID=UPI002D7993B4|nr:pilus assembly protein TadG-related protein [Pseudarthrobacter sp. LT1]WRT12742.1 pilus assembly protein TadG-related protein [Pseudarthrobacter sp. LT1]
MRWLTHPRDPQREEGVAGVMVVLMLVVLIGAGALAVDVGQIYAERAQLQNGADAAALAVAQSCSKGTCQTAVSGPTSIARPLADSNSKDGASKVTKIDTSVPGKVTVTTSTEDGTSGAGFLSKMFASALVSAGPATVGATATATWGGPSSGPASLPLAFAPCQFDFSGATVAMFNKGTGKNCAGDASASGKVIAGGFEWINTISGTCSAVVLPPNPANSDPTMPYVKSDNGANMPSDCNGNKGDNMADYVGSVVLIPVFSGAAGNGAGGIYYIEGFAAFYLDGFVFPGHCAGTYNLVASKCGGSDSGIQGHFVKWVADPTKYEGGGYTDGGTTVPPSLVK